MRGATGPGARRVPSSGKPAVTNVTKAYEEARDRLGGAWLEDYRLRNRVGERTLAGDREVAHEAIARWRGAWMEFITERVRRHSSQKIVPMRNRSREFMASSFRGEDPVCASKTRARSG